MASKTKIVPALHWYDVMRHVQNRESVPACEGASNSSIADQGGWSGGSFADAVGMMRDGWRQGTDKINAMLDKVPESETLATAWNLEAAGFFPCVPAFLSGDPECMWQKADVEQIKPRLCLITQACYSASISSDEALRYGAAASAVLRGLEAAGCDVAIYSVDCVRGWNDNAMAQGIVLRRFGEPLDVSVMSFAFHTSFLRRILFANRELTKQWADAGLATSGYGTVRSVTVKEAKEIIGESMDAVPVLLPTLNSVQRLLTKDEHIPELIEEFKKLVEAAQRGEAPKDEEE